MKPKLVIAIVGAKKSGKTTAVQTLINGLTRKGYMVAAAKHIHEQGFTIDTEGKDTWLFAQAGAQIVVAVAPREIATIQKTSTRDQPSSRLLKLLQRNCGNTDILIIEGFSEHFATQPIPKIVAVKTVREIREAVERFKPIIAFAGPSTLEHSDVALPYVDVLKTPESLVAIVEDMLRKV